MTVISPLLITKHFQSKPKCCSIFSKKQTRIYWTFFLGPPQCLNAEDHNDKAVYTAALKRSGEGKQRSAQI